MPDVGRHSTGLQLARDCFQEAGLSFPQIPGDLPQRLRKIEEWCFSTRDIAHSPYCIDNYVAEGSAGAVADYALLAHSGHGLNSWAIHYYLVWDRLALFLQLQWGGVYMDKERDCAAHRRAFPVGR